MGETEEDRGGGRLVVSVIIPVLHEAEQINELITHLRSLETAGLALELLVVDGAEERDTLEVVKDSDVVKLASSPGRGGQMNTGAARATGTILLFLHADTRLPERVFPFIRETVKEERAGAFSLSIDSKRLSLKLISFVTTLRSRLTRTPYGDQAIFMSQKLFLEQGGFPLIPLMEDLELMRRLRKKGHRVRVSSLVVKTSPRRWEVEGVWTRTLWNWYIRMRYLCGTPADKLVRHYQESKGPGGREDKDHG